ncbi:MAG: HAMP domain-containing histidine kinase [Clostridia bacterium]|nr:HAMP domain-containing histidine kinase [Clostridia bacterium]
MSRPDMILIIITCLSIFGAIFAVLYNRYKTRKTMERMNYMLDKAINGEFDETLFNESLLSAVETKLAHYLSASEVSAKNLTGEKEKIKELIADISHQTKTPVANILLYTQLLGEQKLPKESMEYVKALDVQTEKLNFLIGSLVKTSRLEAGIFVLHPQKNNILPMLQKVQEQIQAKADQKRIKIELANIEIEACFDEKWTEEAIYNIVDNAVKYTPEGGSIAISAAVFHLFAKIDITDTGIGIDKDEHSRIFGRFYRSAKVSDMPGVGIGLYLSRQIVSNEGGYIKVASKPGAGSTFSVFLPCDNQ